MAMDMRNYNNHGQASNAVRLAKEAQESNTWFPLLLEKMTAPLSRSYEEEYPSI